MEIKIPNQDNKMINKKFNLNKFIKNQIHIINKIFQMMKELKMFNKRK